MLVAVILTPFWVAIAIFGLLTWREYRSTKAGIERDRRDFALRQEEFLARQERDNHE